VEFTEEGHGVFVFVIILTAAAAAAASGSGGGIVGIHYCFGVVVVGGSISFFRIDCHFMVDVINSVGIPDNIECRGIAILGMAMLCLQAD